MVSASALECFIPCVRRAAQEAPSLDDRSLVALLLADPRTALQFLGADTSRVRGALIGMALKAAPPPSVPAVAARDVVTAVYPLSFLATGHRVEVRGLLRVHAMCGAAALAVPALLDDDFAMTTIRSRCPQTRRAVRVTAAAGRVLDVTPDGARLGWGTGCRDSRFFAHEDAARRFIGAHGGDPSDAVPVALAFDVLRRVWGRLAEPGGAGAAGAH